ncbi:MAG: biopolymer transporter ExbD [Pirellulales bacterium]|nr:biopolymer transporter ExbD [Pirellulales bacterium]
MARMELKVVSLGRVYGPVPMETLIRLATEGRISAEDLVRPAGATDWQPLTQIPALAAVVRVRPAGGAYADFDEDEFAGSTLPRAGKRPEDETEIDMTPMIDCTFLLLIFFMLTNALANPVPMEVPHAIHGRGVTLEGQQLVLIDADGNYYLGNTPVKENQADSLDALLQEVGRNAAANEKTLDVIVYAHKKTRYLKLRELIERLGALDGLGPVMIGVEEKLN